VVARNSDLVGYELYCKDNKRPHMTKRNGASSPHAQTISKLLLNVAWIRVVVLLKLNCCHLIEIVFDPEAWNKEK